MSPQESIALFALRLGVTFRQLALLEEALTHRSYRNEHLSWGRPHNERLEYLGDAILQTIVTKELFQTYPYASEGELTDLRSLLVCTEMLAAVARELGVNEALLLSRGEARDTGRARERLLADALEAIIGAISLDQEFAVVEAFVKRFITVKLPDALARGAVHTAKGRFQAFTQAHMGTTPHYKLLNEEGPVHDRRFRMGVFAGKCLVGSGEGRTKQEAEQHAALEALCILGQAKGGIRLREQKTKKRERSEHVL